MGSINLGSNCHIACNYSRHASWWRCYLHCGIEVTGSPGIICIICHQVLHHRSKYGTGSRRKHLLANAQIAKLDELTESKVIELTCSMVKETTLGILKRQGSPGITVVSIERKIIFDIQVYPYWLKWQTKRFKLTAKDYEPSQFQQGMWNHYLILEFVLVYIPGNTISNGALRQLSKALSSDIVLPSATSFSNICWREYALTVDVIRKQLPS